MKPLVFVWPYAVVFWILFLWAFTPEWRIILKAQQRVKKRESKDDASLRIITVGMQTSSLVAFLLPFVLGSWFQAGNQSAWFLVGVLLLFSGGLLRRHCWRMLGEYFTGEVIAKPEQQVISTGAYKWIRHPSYTAGIMMMAGIGLAFGNWASFVVLVGTAFAVYLYRIRVEERALVETLGGAYQSYMEGRKRLIPFIF